MTYFTYFPGTTYQFGDEKTFNVIQNLSSYVDIVDQIKDQVAFYKKYVIGELERPDQLSYKLYGTTGYYWTFFLLNDHIRRGGWPLSSSELISKVMKLYPDTTITTRSDLTLGFKSGDKISSTSSGLEYTVVRKLADIGQIVIEGTHRLSNGEVLTDGTNNIIVYSYSEEYNSAAYYIDGNGNHVQFDPSVGPGVLQTEVTYLDHMIAENDNLKEIKVVKPESIVSVTSAFQEAMGSGI